MQKGGLVVIILGTLILGMALGYNYSNIRQNAQLEESYNSLGWQFYNIGNYDEAINEFKNYLQKNENNFFAHNGLAWSFFRKGQYFEAINSFKTATNLNPPDSNSFNGLGW